MSLISHSFRGITFDCYENEKLVIEDVGKHLDLYQGPLRAVLDIGAHIGTLSLFAFKRGASLVVAIEPSKFNFYRLCRNILKNGAHDVVIPMMVAISGSGGMKRLCGIPGAYGQAGYCFNERFTPIGEVPSITLDSIVEAVGEVDYLKMDVEGAEFDILLGPKGPKDSTFSRIGYLDVEIHDVDNRNFFPENALSREELMAFLSSKGFDSNSGGYSFMSKNGRWNH